jgi:hypothetical protein
VADVCRHAAESNTNGCHLVLEDTHCRTFLVSQQCGVVLVNFVRSIILTVLYFKDGIWYDEYLKWSVGLVTLCVQVH